MGQEHADNRALPFTAFDPDGAAGLTGDAMHLGETETGSLAERLGREERFGCARRNIGRHSGPGVRDGDADIVSGLDIGSSDAADGQLQLLAEYLAGEAGGLAEQSQSSRISRLIIAGNSLAPIDTSKGDSDRKLVCTLHIGRRGVRC